MLVGWIRLTTSVPLNAYVESLNVWPTLREFAQRPGSIRSAVPWRVLLSMGAIQVHSR